LIATVAVSYSLKKAYVDSKDNKNKRGELEMKVFIDPGHGGKDPGAVAHGLREKDLALTIAKRVKEILEDYQGVQVRLSREDDSFLELTERTQMANVWGSDFFLSIHINAGGGVGFESFIYNGNVSPTTVTNQNVIHAEIMKAIGGLDRGKKTANFAVLRTSKMPALLTETLFIDNAKDAVKLKDPAFLELAAQGHVNGLVKAYGLKKAKGTPILGKPSATIAQAQEWARSHRAPQEFIDLAPLYWEIAPKRGGVDPAVLYVQFGHETGYLYRDGKSMAGIDASYHNPCGLKITQGGSDTNPNAHKKFKDWHEGITAHADHASLYAGADGYPMPGTPDPRHFPYLLGTVKTVEGLGGRWAPSATYGERLASEIKKLQSTIASELRDELTIAIEELQKVGIINSPNYWLEVAHPGQVAKGEYLRQLILNMANHLRGN
jgi:N-acetylmuramoyl-L-alanine amidase